MSFTPTPAKPGQSPRQKLRIGVQIFARIFEDGRYYLDKAGFALQLIQKGTHYFLSRPHCFGKSLFPDTLARATKPCFAAWRRMINGTGAGAARWLA